MNVSAILVTRGDVDMQPVLDSLPDEWERVVWDNSASRLGAPYVKVWEHAGAASSTEGFGHPDLAVFGRYAAIEYASHDVIYVADDDCIVSDPQAIVDAWEEAAHGPVKTNLVVPAAPPPEYVVCNMPQRFRHDFYEDHALVGFGAAFHRDAPARAFQRMTDVVPTLGLSNYGWWLPGFPGNDHFNNTCDVAFTALTPRVLVDVPKTDREFASDPGRMWTTEGYQEERSQMLELVRKVRDA